MPHPRSRSAATAVALAAALAAGSLPATAAAQTAPTVELQILGINDFHGHLDPGAGSAPSVAGVLGGAVKTLRGQNPDTVFVSAGDNIGASPFISSSQRDEPTIDVLNTMGLAASAVGNHEFDRGYADLAGRVVPRAQFPFLGANVEGESPALRDSTVVTTASGVRIGFVGVVTQDTATLVAPSGIAGITFSDPVAAANRAADALSDGDAANGEADVVVLLAHEGAATAAPANATNASSCAALASRDDAFGRIIKGANDNVDAILGGHTHLVVDCEFPLSNGQVRPVLEAAEYGTRLDRLRLTYDTAAKRITGVAGEVLPLTATGGVFPFTADPAVEAVVDAAEAKAAELGREVIGSITQDIPRARTASGAEDRGEESLLGNFIADVQLRATRTPSQPGGPTEIALMNPGGLRADLLFANSAAGEQPGQVTFSEVAVVQPFANTLFTLSLTGAQLKQVLEEQYQPAGSSRPFLALGVSRGLRYQLQGTAPAGSRVSGLTLDGLPVDPSRTYRVVTNSFLASGGDNFRTLATGADRRDTGLDDLAVLVAHFRANSPITPATEDRSNVLTPCAPTSITLSRSTVDGVGTVDVAISATPSATVELLGYTRPATAYRSITVVKTSRAGTATVSLRPTGGTRVYAQQVGCQADPVTDSRVVSVRSTLSIDALRTAVRSYVFSGRVLPARAGQVVSLYRVTSTGEQVLTARATTAADGTYRISRRFTGSGRFGFLTRTGSDLTTLAGTSRVRPTVVH